MSKYDIKNYNSCLFNHGFGDKWDGNCSLMLYHTVLLVESLLYSFIGIAFDATYCYEFYTLLSVIVSTQCNVYMYWRYSFSYRMFHKVFGTLTAINILLRVFVVIECLDCAVGENSTSNILVSVVLVINVIATMCIISMFVAMVVLMCSGCEKRLEEYEEILREEDRLEREKAKHLDKCEYAKYLEKCKKAQIVVEVDTMK